MDMLRSIGEQSAECAESVLKKKRWEGFKPGMKVRGDGILISINVSSITTV